MGCTYEVSDRTIDGYDSEHRVDRGPYPYLMRNYWNKRQWFRAVNPGIIVKKDADGRIFDMVLYINNYGRYFLKDIDDRHIDERRDFGLPWKPKDLANGKQDGPSTLSDDDMDWRDLYALADIGSHLYWYRQVMLEGRSRDWVSDSVWPHPDMIARSESYRATKDMKGWRMLDTVYSTMMDIQSTDEIPSDEKLLEVWSKIDGNDMTPFTESAHKTLEKTALVMQQRRK